MRKLCYRMVCISAFMMAFALYELPALAGDNILEVQCLDQAGSPVAGVTVNIQSMASPKWKDKKSDSKGTAVLDKLDDGYYRVIGRKSGLAPAIFEFVVLKGGARQQAGLKFAPGDEKSKVYWEDNLQTQKAYDLLNAGLEALRGNKFAEAEKFLADSLAIFPSNPDSLLNMGIALVQQRKWDRAEEFLKKGQVSSSAFDSMPKPKDASGSNPTAETGKRIDLVLAKMPVIKLRGEADAALAEKRFAEAAAKYIETAKLEPADADLFYNLALAQANARQFDDATQSVQKAIQLKPSETAYGTLRKQIADLQENAVLSKAQALINEGQELVKKNDFAAAIQKYETALPMVPANKQGIIWEQIAVARANSGQEDQAMEAFKKAVELTPDNSAYREALAQYYLRVKKYDEALNVYSDPRTAGSKPLDETLFALGKTLSGKGNNDVAQLAFDRAIKANPQNAEAYYELGMSIAYGEKRDDKRAIELLTKYLEIGKDSAHLENTKSVLVVVKKRK
jgi:tetratricopeptide (TPR) repeat protein